MTSRFLKVFFGSHAMALAGSVVCALLGSIFAGPEVMPQAIRYAYWPLFLISLPICMKYLK